MVAEGREMLLKEQLLRSEGCRGAQIVAERATFEADWVLMSTDCCKKSSFRGQKGAEESRLLQKGQLLRPIGC
jgi:hypothetical protein